MSILQFCNIGECLKSLERTTSTLEVRGLDLMAGNRGHVTSKSDCMLGN